MPSTVEELADNRVKLTVQIPFADLKPSLDKAYREIAKQISIPGFRKGKVPPAVIDQRMGRGTVLNEALNEVLPQALGQALSEHKITPLGPPEVEITKLDDGNDVEFTAEVDKRPDFTIPDVAGVAVTVDPIQVDEGEVDERVDLLRRRMATLTEVDRAAAKGDVVVVDLVGSRDGQPLPDASADDVSLTVGDGNLLDGLDEAVTGLKAGESKTFASTLVGGALQGEEADIEVTVKKVQEQQLPEVDDDFAQMVSQFDTVDEMKADLKEGVERLAKLEQAADARDKVLEAIVEKCDFQVPEKLVESQIADVKANIEAQLRQGGMTLEQYLERNEDNRSADDFWAEVERNAAIGVKAKIVLEKLAEDTEVPITQEDLTNYLFQRAQQNGTSPEQEAQHMMEHNHIGQWMEEIRRGKALDQLVAGATVTDTDGKPVDMSILNPAPAQAAADAGASADDSADAEGDSTEEG